MVTPLQRIQIGARLIYAYFSDWVAPKKIAGTEEETSRINPTKPYKRRRLKMDPISTMRRRLYKMTTRDPKIVRKRQLYRKLYNRKNKQLLKKRGEFVREAKKRLPPPAGKLNKKRKSPAAN